MATCITIIGLLHILLLFTNAIYFDPQSPSHATSMPSQPSIQSSSAAIASAQSNSNNLQQVYVAELCTNATPGTEISIKNDAGITLLFDRHTESSDNKIFYNPPSNITDCKIVLSALSSDLRYKWDFIPQDNFPVSFDLSTASQSSQKVIVKYYANPSGSAAPIQDERIRYESVRNQQANLQSLVFLISVVRSDVLGSYKYYQPGYYCSQMPSKIYTCYFNNTVLEYTTTQMTTNNCSDFSANVSAIDTTNLTLCQCKEKQFDLNDNSCELVTAPAINFRYDFTVYIDGECKDTQWFQCYSVPYNSSMGLPQPTRCIDYSAVCDPYSTKNCRDPTRQGWSYDQLGASQGGVCKYEYIAEDTYGPAYVALWLPWLGFLVLIFPFLYWCCWRPGWCPWRCARLRQLCRPCMRSCAKRCGKTCGCCSRRGPFCRPGGPCSKCSHCSEACKRSANSCTDYKGTGAVKDKYALPPDMNGHISRENAFMLGQNRSIRTRKITPANVDSVAPMLLGKVMKREKAFLGEIAETDI